MQIFKKLMSGDNVKLAPHFPTHTRMSSYTDINTHIVHLDNAWNHILRNIYLQMKAGQMD